MIDIDPGEDTLVFIGDYIDRGPDPKGVVDFILDVKARVPNTVCLLGNHEQMFLDYLKGIDGDLFLNNGGISTLSSYGLPFASAMRDRKQSMPESHRLFFTSLRPYYETSDYIFVHAGLRPGISLPAQNGDDMLWIRSEFINSPYDFAKTIVFGHTPLRKPYINGKKIGIDTGAVYGGKLTCIMLPERKLYQV
jgi:serine/threonine protein phosphatase 1